MIQQAAQEFLATDLAFSRCGDEFGVQDFIALTLVRPARVIIAAPLAQQVVKVAQTEAQEVVKTLTFDFPDRRFAK